MDKTENRLTGRERSTGGSRDENQNRGDPSEMTSTLSLNFLWTGLSIPLRLTAQQEVPESAMISKSDTTIEAQEQYYDCTNQYLTMIPEAESRTAMSVFFYGTLLVPAILVRVLGHKCDNFTFQVAILSVSH